MICELYLDKAAKQTKQIVKEEGDRLSPPRSKARPICAPPGNQLRRTEDRGRWATARLRGNWVQAQAAWTLSRARALSGSQPGLWGVWQDHGVRNQFVKILVMSWAPDTPFLTKPKGRSQSGKPLPFLVSSR